MLWVGVDVGGTFTDVVVFDASANRIHSGKSPSNPADPAAAVLRALQGVDVDLAQVGRFRHGATVATNTALERAGARLGVLTTSGHRDVLVIGKGNRVRLYDIKATRPPGLVQRSQVLEIPERMASTGEPHLALDEDAIAEAVQTLRGLEVEAVAVCFLHSYANPIHEERAATLLREALPDVPIVTSADVVPEMREFERFSTTALNAYVAPRMGQYLGRLEHSLHESGLAVAPEIMTSSGGSWRFERMAKLPVNSMLSGPAGGVIGAVSLAEQLGLEQLITYDMGGTSTDTAMVREGHYDLATEGTIGGLPNRAPQIEINTVGAGGGSLAYIDTGGFLNVGPRSAGSVPGPACYGRGGTEPTVTDANVVLGRFRAEQPLGGEIVLDVPAAEAAVDGLGNALGLSRAETAEGIVRLAVTKMTGAIKEISVMRGIDPRDFALLAFGGAGPLHAAAITEELGMRQVVVPPLPGAFSAYGLLVAERRHDVSRSRLMTLQDTTMETIRAFLEPLRESARGTLRAEGFSDDQIRLEVSVDMRFRGQAFELATPLGDDVDNVDAFIAEFHRVYEARYAHADSGLVEAVSFRVAAYGQTEKPTLPTVDPGGSLHDAKTSERPVQFGGEVFNCPVYWREWLPVDEPVNGPAVVDEAGAATIVPPDFQLTRHPTGALFLLRGDS
ncbi:MAG: hydantoinase/oxoprolinase family protein [Pseudomonadota bacterium]